MNRLIVFMVALFLPFSCLSDEEDFLVLGAGVMSVKNIPATHLQKTITGTQGVESSSSTDSESNYQSFAIGKCFNAHFCVEGAYLSGVEFRRTINILNANLGVINVNGYSYNTGSVPVNLSLQQKISVTASQLSFVGKLPVDNWLDVFARVGFYDYRLKLVSKLPLYDNVFLAEESTEHGTIPMVSLGFEVMPFDSKRFRCRFEGQKTGPVGIYSVSVVYNW